LALASGGTAVCTYRTPALTASTALSGPRPLLQWPWNSQGTSPAAAIIRGSSVRVRSGVSRPLTSLKQSRYGAMAPASAALRTKYSSVCLGETEYMTLMTGVMPSRSKRGSWAATLVKSFQLLPVRVYRMPSSTAFEISSSPTSGTTAPLIDGPSMGPCQRSGVFFAAAAP
jgi:hypothetical protein